MTDTEQPSAPEPPDRRRLSKLAVAALVFAVLEVLLNNISRISAAQRRSWDSCPWFSGSVESDIVTLGALFLLLAAATLLAAVVLLVVRRRLSKGWVFVGLTAAMLAIDVFPSLFIHIHSRQKGVEARFNLKGAFLALKANTGDGKTFPVHLADAGLTLEPKRGYAYFYRDDVIQPDRPGHGPYSKDQFPPVLKKLLDECKDVGFVVYAVGNIDCDPNLDVWAMNDRNSLVNVYNDEDDVEWDTDWTTMSEFCRKSAQ